MEFNFSISILFNLMRQKTLCGMVYLPKKPLKRQKSATLKPPLAPEADFLYKLPKPGD